MVNFYRAHLLADDLENIHIHMTQYETLIIQYLKKPHSPEEYKMLDELIYLLIKHNCLDIAQKYLFALVFTGVANSGSHTHSFIPHFFQFFDSLVEINQIEKGFKILNKFLSEYCPESEKPTFSFLFALTLQEQNKLELLCDIVSNYGDLWDEKLASNSMPLLQIFKTISNLSFYCMNLRANNGNV